MKLCDPALRQGTALARRSIHPAVVPEANDLQGAIRPGHLMLSTPGRQDIVQGVHGALSTPDHKQRALQFGRKILPVVFQINRRPCSIVFAHRVQRRWSR